MPAPKAHDTSRLKRGFLEEYRQCGNITLAAEVVGIDRRTHYRWSEADPGYCEAFESATEEAIDRLEAEARRRAVEGVEEPTGWYKGEPGGFVRRYSDTLLIFLLKGAAPDKYRDRVEVRGLLARLDLNLLPNHLVARIAAGEHPEAVLASGASDAGITPGELVRGALAPGPPPEDNSHSETVGVRSRPQGPNGNDRPTLKAPRRLNK